MKFYFGSDTYSLQSVMKKLRKDAKEKGIDLRELKVDSDQTDSKLLNALQEALHSQGLFSSEQIVIAHDFVANAGKYPMTEEFILDRLKIRDSDGSDLILLETEKVDKRKKLYKALKKNADAKEFEIPTGKDLGDWIVRYLKRRQYEIEPAALQRFQEMVEGGGDREVLYDLWQVTGELEKLMLFEKASTKISRESVEKVVSENLTENVFVLTNLFAEGKSAQAASFVEQIIGRGASSDTKGRVIQLVGALAGQIHSLLQVSSVSGTAKQIAEQLGWKEGRVWINQKLARSFDVEKLKRMLVDLQAIDRRLKTSEEPEKLLLTLFLQKK